MTEISPGTRVQYSDGRQGVVRYIGNTHFSPGQWVGIELDDDSGKNDGTVQGQRYFECSPGHGMFVRPDAVIGIAKQVPRERSITREPVSVNGSTVKLRQSNISADTARKRQSLMGPGGSRHMPGLRLSLRSPTKSPTKGTTSRENSSSGRSSPRTATPTTTARTSSSSTKSRLSISGRSSMGPPPPPHPPTFKAQARPSIGMSLSRPNRTDPLSPPWPSATSSTGHLQSPSMSRNQSSTTNMVSEDLEVSPSIDEEEEGGKESNGEQSPALEEGESTRIDRDRKDSKPEISPRDPQDGLLRARFSQTPVNGMVSARGKIDNSQTAIRELEQMKAKYTIMERKRMEDRDKLKSLETMKEERDKFENTLQKLQRKCQTQSKEMAEWRKQVQESEAKVEGIEREQAEQSSEIEHVTIDKEVAEERLECATVELENSKQKCEALELELELVREENQELSSGMTSEERSSAGWLQMEKENQRLRDALVALRDMTQQSETGLKNHVKELEDDLDGFEALQSEHEKAKTELAASRIAVHDLKENLDAADQQELLVTQITEEKDAMAERLNLLSAEVMRLNEDAELSLEIQDTQNSTERLLQGELDDVKAFALDCDQKARHQAKVIDDLEYTLLKFKEMADGLQNDLQELQANKQVNESEAHELNAKSRAMLDLNLRLQTTAAKTQTRKVELELNQVNAEDAATHLAMIQSFIPETFKAEKDPILALLRFKRIASKAKLLRTSIEENVNHPTDNISGDKYVAFNIVEKLQWIISSCSRSHNCMQGCTVEDFSKFSDAFHELEPVERAIDTGIEAAKRQDMDSLRFAADLQRIIPLLADLSEKTVPSSLDTFADTFTGISEMIKLHTETVGLELDLINETVRNKIVRSEEDDEGLDEFSQQIRMLVDHSRSSRVVAGKVYRAIDEKRNHSMMLSESSLISFEQAASVGKRASELLRIIGQGLLERFDGDEVFKLDDVWKIMQDSAIQWLKGDLSKISKPNNFVETVGKMLSEFHSKIEGLFNLASDLSNYAEYERHPAPWIVRAKILNEQKVVDTQMEAQLRRLQSQANERSVVLNAKDKAIEEQSLKIELLEARSKGTKDHATALQNLERRLAAAVVERDKAVDELETLTKENLALSRKCDEARADPAMQTVNNVAVDLGAAAAWSSNGESAAWRLAADAEILKDEIKGLQSAVRFLKAENHRLLYPATPAGLAATNHAWLEANPLPKSGRISNDRHVGIAAEAKDVFSRLLEVSIQIKPLQLRNDSTINARGKQSSWRPIKTTPRYLASRQREELEKWTEWRNDLISRAIDGQIKKAVPGTGLQSAKSDVPGTPQGRVVDSVEIVGSPP